MRSAPAIGFEYKPSRVLAIAAALLIVLAGVAIWLSGVAAWLKSVLETVVAIHGVWSMRCFLRPHVRGVNWRSDGSVSIRLEKSGSEAEMQAALRDARVLGPLIVLHLHWPRGRAGLWLLPDNLDADTRRRLCARLALDGTRMSVNADSV